MNSSEETYANDAVKLSRRDLFWTLGASASLIGLGAQAFANEGKITTPPGLSATLPDDAGTYPRAVFSTKPPYDLSDPRHVAFARLRTIDRLDGEKTYVTMLTRKVWCPRGKPSGPIFYSLDFWSSFIEEAPGADGAGTQVIKRLLSTRVPFIPGENGTDEARLDTSQSQRHFAASIGMDLTTGRDIRLTDDNEAEEDAAEANAGSVIRFGPDLLFHMVGARMDEGPHQPQIDLSTWSADYDKLMDPNVDFVPAQYSFSAILPKSLGDFPEELVGDAEGQTMIHRTGLKFASPEDLPDMVKRLVVDRFPDRV